MTSMTTTAGASRQKHRSVAPATTPGPNRKTLGTVSETASESGRSGNPFIHYTPRGAEVALKWPKVMGKTLGAVVETLLLRGPKVSFQRVTFIIVTEQSVLYRSTCAAIIVHIASTCVVSRARALGRHCMVARASLHSPLCPWLI